MIKSFSNRALLSLIYFFVTNSILFTSISSWATELDFSLSKHTARLGLASPLNTPNTFLNMDILHREHEGNVASMSLLVGGPTKGSTGLEFTGISAKLVGFDSNEDNLDANGSALAMGLLFRHNLETANLITIGGSIHYAPSVIAFGDAERYLEWDLKLEYQIMEQASIYLGHHSIKARIDSNNDYKPINHAILGWVISF